MRQAIENLAEMIDVLEKENARDAERLAARQTLLLDLRRTYNRYQSMITGKSEPNNHPQSAPAASDSTSTGGHGDTPGGPTVPAVATKSPWLGSSDTTSRSQRIRQMLMKSETEMSTLQIMQRLRELGDTEHSEKDDFWRIVDSVLRRGAKIGIYKKVRPATWEAIKPSSGNFSLFEDKSQLK